jgi:hypothetical protein
LISAAGTAIPPTLSIQVLLDGFCVFNTSPNGAIERHFIEELDELLQWLSEHNLEGQALKLIYTTAASVVPKELFKAANSADYLKFQSEDAVHIAFTELKKFGLTIVFATNPLLESKLKKMGAEVFVTHSAHELMKRALVIPNKEWIRLVSIFHPKQIEIVFHKGPELLAYNQFTIQGNLDANYYLQLLQTTSKYSDFSVDDIICYENGSNWGAQSFEQINDSAKDAQYITEVYPFL